MLEQNLPLRHKQQFIVSHNFPGSAQLCLVRESTACEPKLLFWNGSTAKVTSSFKRNGRVFRPLLIPANIQSNLRLPLPPRPYGSVEKLVTGIATAFQQYAHVSDRQGRLLADCCLASWFPEAWPVAPCLSITSAVAPDRVLILHFLSCFCRHSMVLGQASAQSLLHVAPGLQPTLLINYSEVPRKVQALLNVGCYRWMPIPGAAGEMIDVFGMKVLAAAQPAIWLENALHLAIPPRQGGPATCWKKTLLEKLASEFQPQLLMYRLEHLKEIAVSDWDIPEFVSPVREIARSIGRCLCSANLREDLIGLLGQEDEETRTAWSIDERAIVIEALLLACHDPQKTSVYIGEAAQIANGILKLRGEKPCLTARGVGAVLKAVGLRTQRLGKAGRGLRLDEQRRTEIHRLARNYGVRSIMTPFRGCHPCEEIGGAGARRTLCTSKIEPFQRREKNEPSAAAQPAV